MLALSRKPGEELVFEVGGLVFTVGVVAIQGNKARLAIEAPREVRVMRREVLEKADGKTPAVPQKKVDEYAHLYQELGGSE